MKMKFTRALGMLLAFALVFTLMPSFASREAFAEGENEKAWSASLTDFDLTPFNISYLNAFGYTDQGIYCSGTALAGKNIPEGAVEEYYGQYDVYDPILVFISYDGEVQKLDYTPFTMEREHADKYSYESQCYQQGVRLLPDGTFAELAVFSEYWCSVPNLTSEDDVYWENYRSSEEYYLRHLNADGTEIATFLIPTLEDDYIGSVTSDANGNVICGMSNKLLSISPADGSLNWIQTLDVYPDRVFTLRDGSLAYTSWTELGNSLFQVNAATGETGARVSIPAEAYVVFSGGGDYPLYYSNGATFFGLKPDTDQKVVLFNWLNLDVAVEIYGELFVREDGTVIGLAYDDTENDSQAGGSDTAVYRIFRVSPAESTASQKTVITLATPWLDFEKRANVLRFNRTSEEYHIELLDYSVYNTGEEWNAGLTKLENDLLSGAIAPDIIDLASLNIEKLAANGILEDLYPYMDASDSVRRSDLFPSVLAAAEVDGKLYYTVPGFSINTVVGESALVGENPGWTYRAFRDALASRQGARALSAYTTAIDVFRPCFSMDFSRYVDLSNGTCSFENGDFLDLLTFAAGFPAEYDWEGYTYETDGDTAAIASGRQLFYSAYIASATDAIYYGAAFNGRPYTYIGYPVNSGTGNYFVFQPGMAIGASSTHKDVVWDFISRYFTEDAQKDQYLLPSNRNVLLARMQELMQMSYRTDANGNQILDEAGQPIPEARAYYGDGTGLETELYVMTQQDADRLLQLIETTTRREVTVEGVNSIVEEQANAFFHNSQTAEETAHRIQLEVTSYLQQK